MIFCPNLLEAELKRSFSVDPLLTCNFYPARVSDGSLLHRLLLLLLMGSPVQQVSATLLLLFLQQPPPPHLLRLSRPGSTVRLQLCIFCEIRWTSQPTYLLHAAYVQTKGPLISALTLFHPSIQAVRHGLSFEPL